MAVFYCRSTTGSDANDGSTWALATATIASAINLAGVGDTIWVSHVHAETQATSITFNDNHGSPTPTKIMCGNDGAEPPTTLATTATVTTTGASNITLYGPTYYYGITFTVGSGSSAANASIASTGTHILVTFDNCAFILGTTSISSKINIGSASTGNSVLWKNVTVGFGHVSQTITVSNAIFTWLNTQSAILGAVYPTNLLNASASASYSITLAGLDISALGSGNTVITQASGAYVGSTSIRNCKIGASVTVVGSITVPVMSVSIHNSDSSDTNYRMEQYDCWGSTKSETVKVRTGGASDGTTALSWNMTSVSGALFVTPLASPQFSIWNDTTGSSKTVTVEILHDSVTALTDADIWLEVEEMGTSGYPISTIQSDRAANILATPANQDASSATWTTTGLTNPNKQYLQVTFTPAKKGFFQARVILAKATKTVYIDPLMTVA